jgi:hypothetical protein
MASRAARRAGIHTQEERDSNLESKFVIWCLKTRSSHTRHQVLVQCLFFRYTAMGSTNGDYSDAGVGGVVRNASGQPITGATIEISGQEGGSSAVSGADGSFSFLNLAPGRYALTVRLPNKMVTAAISIRIPGTAVVLTVSQKNTLAIGAAPVAQAIGAKAASDGEKLSSQSVSELHLGGRGDASRFNNGGIVEVVTRIKGRVADELEKRSVKTTFLPERVIGSATWSSHTPAQCRRASYGHPRSVSRAQHRHSRLRTTSIRL